MRWILLSILFALPLTASSKELNTSAPTILWGFTSSGEKVPSARSVLVTNRHPLFRLYHSEMKNYNHSTFTGTMSRIEHELKTKRLVCFPGSSDADKRRSFTYLTPQYIQPSPQLVTRKEVADLLLKEGSSSILLRDVLKNKSLTGVIGKARSYGPSIDTILSEFPENPRPIVIETFGPQILQMIESKAADYSIEYPFIVNAHKEGHGAFTDLITIPLSDVAPIMIQYLACSKTAEGLAVIKQADEIIRKNAKDPFYWKALLNSLPESQRPTFQIQIDAFVKGRLEKPQIVE